jgi:hypothetical protein
MRVAAFALDVMSKKPKEVALVTTTTDPPRVYDWPDDPYGFAAGLGPSPDSPEELRAYDDWIAENCAAVESDMASRWRAQFPNSSTPMLDSYLDLVERILPRIEQDHRLLAIAPEHHRTPAQATMIDEVNDRIQHYRERLDDLASKERAVPGHVHARLDLDCEWDLLLVALEDDMRLVGRLFGDDIEIEVAYDRRVAMHRTTRRPSCQARRQARRMTRTGTSRARRSSRSRAAAKSSGGDDSPGSSDPAPPSAGMIKSLRRSFALLLGGAR